MSDLKPCPHCDGSEFTFRTDDIHNLNSVVTWHELHCQGCYAMARSSSKVGLVEKWNRRALIGVSPDDAKIIAAMMEEFWRKHELSPEEERAFLTLCSLAGIGRPVRI